MEVLLVTRPDGSLLVLEALVTAGKKAEETHGDEWMQSRYQIANDGLG